MEDKVSNTHPIYDKLTPRRAAYQAVKNGTDALQAGGETYLRKFPAEADVDYKARLKASTIDGIVAGGVETLCGAVFEGEIDTSKVNPQIVPFLENIDNRGNHFNVFVRDAFDSSFDGHSVIVVDMPAETDETRQLQRTYGAEADKILNKRPYWILYKANDVTNWRYNINPQTNKEELALLVVKVVTVEPDGQFKTKEVTRYRVWQLESGRVRWQTWIETEKQGSKEKEFAVEKEGVLSNMTAIPAAIVGCLTDEPKLLVETRLEIKAYQKESSYDVIEYLSIPVFYTVGYEAEEPIALGANTHIKLPGGKEHNASAGYVQIDSAGHDSLKQTIEGIKKKIGGRLDTLTKETQPANEQTATEVVSDDRKSQARLIVWAEQLKDAVELALGFTSEFMGQGRDKGGEVIFNTAWALAEQKAKEAEDFDRTIITEEMEIARKKAQGK